MKKILQDRPGRALEPMFIGQNVFVVAIIELVIIIEDVK